MSKKDFIALAAILRQYNDTHVGQAIAREMAVYLITRNATFNWARFLEACGLEPFK